MARRRPVPAVRRVRSKDERGGRSQFIRLKADEKFVAHALFTCDPELEENPGYFEYFDHWDQQGNTYVPCIGEDCIFCRAGAQPSTRALSLWYFPDEDEGKKVKVFTMNWTLIQEATDIEEEEDEPLLGKQFRVKRLDDRGQYRMRQTNTKSLTEKQVNSILKDAPDLDEILQRQVQKQLERLAAADAMKEVDDEDDSDDEDDDEEETRSRKSSKASSGSKSRKGKPAEEDEPEEDDEDEAENTDPIEESVGRIVSVQKSKGYITVAFEGEDGEEEEIQLYGEEADFDGLKKGQEHIFSAEWDDEDEQYVIAEISAYEPDEEEDGEEEEEDSDEDEGEDGDESESDDDERSMEGVELEVISTNEQEATVKVKNSDLGTFMLYIDSKLNKSLPWDDLSKGDEISVDMEKDDEDDWIATALDKTGGAKKSGRRKART